MNKLKENVQIASADDLRLSCPDTGLGLFKLTQTWPTKPVSEDFRIPAVGTERQEIAESQEETKALALIGV